MHALGPGRALAGIAAGATLALCGAAGARAPTRPPSTADRAPARLPAATVAARERFFGAAAVDHAGHVRRDRVILSWFGVSSLAASFRGHVVLLDSFVNGTPRDGCTGRRPPPPSGYVPACYDDLAALRPEAIFIGHEHFDHACRTVVRNLHSGPASGAPRNAAGAE